MLKEIIQNKKIRAVIVIVSVIFFIHSSLLCYETKERK